MHQTICAAALRLLAPLFLCLFFSNTANAQISPAVAHGVQWLNSQVQANGSLQNEAQAIATPMQSRAEAAQTLQQLSTLPAALSANVNAVSEINTQYLARKIIALGAANVDVSAYVATLTQLQNQDGGYGGAFAYASDPINTAWAVLALAQTTQSASNAANLARSYLSKQISADGGVFDTTPISRIYDSAIVLQALQTTPDGSNAGFISSLNAWLQMQQNSDGSWAGSSFLTAYSLLALTPVNSDASVTGNAASYLLSKQATDGSWSEDPYLSAVILRALSGQPANSAGIMQVQGQVIDSASNMPLGGVNVSVTGNSAVATTDNNGSFTLNGLTAGSYVIGIAASGYSGATRSVAVASGQTTNVGTIALTQIGTAAIVRGQIVAAGSATPLAGVTVTISGAASASAVTDAGGRYVITGITAGSVTITASLSGYQSATGSGTLVAGQSINFAPGLYANGQTVPSSVQFSGTVVASGSSTPLNGVAIQFSGASTNTASTGANGQFAVAINPGSSSASFTLAGYTGITQNFIAAAGAAVNVGIVDLAPILASSTIKGQVFNAANQALAGATVQVVDTTITATTAADGSYVLNNVTGTAVSVRASAAGLDSQTVNLQLPQPALVTQNFTLAAQTAGNLSIGALTVAPASAGSNATVTVSTIISNTGSNSASAVLALQILDPSGSVVGSGTAYDGSGNQIGQLTLSGAQSFPVNLTWKTAQFAPGVYSLSVQLLQVGSVTRALPLGVKLAEARTTVSVVGQPHFSGSISASPPVLQAGTNTVVQLSAVLRNDGNVALPAQTLTLSVTNTADNSLVLSEVANSTSLPVNALQTIVFSSWTPAAGGNYQLTVTAADPTMGSMVGSVYVGDSGSAIYTTNKSIVPTGTQTVRGTVSVSGQNVASGTISDPLAPLIKSAVQSAIPYGYTTAAADTMASLCTRCHVQSQAVVGGELTSNLTDYASFLQSRNIILDALTITQQSNGSLDGHTDIGPYAYDETMLAMWSLNAWHNHTEFASTMAKAVRYLNTIQNSDGTWVNDYTGGWWDSTMGMTAFNVKNLVDFANTLPQIPAGAAADFTTTAVASQGIAAPYGLATDASNNVYLIDYDSGSISTMGVNGSLQPFMTGLNNPTAMIFTSDGTAYVSSYGGFFQRKTDGTVTQISAIPGSGLAIGPDGNFYMASLWENKISMITPSGVATDYIVGGALSAPWGIAFAPNGDMVVTNFDAQNIVRYHPDLTQDTPVAWTYGTPHNIVATANGWLVSDGSGLYSLDSDWHVERLLYTSTWGLTVRSDGSVFIGDDGNDAVIKLVKNPIDLVALQSNMDASIGKGTAWLLQDSNVDATNNLQMAQRLIGLNAASGYYKGQPLAATLQAKMLQVGTQLRANVNPDGGWGWTTSYTSSDSLVTAQVGVALDSLNPSASDPIVQNAVKLLLGRQGADGTWYSENGIMTTPLATTTWVSIWLPIVLNRLGGIDTDLSVTFPSNITMANPDTTPASVTPNGDGTSTALWHLTGVTSAGQAVNYDLTLANMAPNEVRPVSTDAHLTFNNSFTGGTVDAPITIPQVTASAFLNLGVSTDKASYPANTLINITGQVSNTSNALNNGSVTFEIDAPNGNLVASLGSMPFNQLAANASINLGKTWNTGNAAAGAGYSVLATLYDSAGALVSNARSPFAITSSSGSGAATSASAGLSTDKQIYQANDTVKLADRLTNASANTALNALTVLTSVTNPAGAIIYTKSEALPQLAAGAQKNYAYSVTLSGAPAGVYQANLLVTGSDGSTVAQASAAFSVATSAANGNGLTGTISLAANQVQLGNPVAMSFNATNSGNAALAGLPLTVSIVDPVAQKILASFPTTQNLAVGASYAGNDNWTAAGTVGNSYVAVLSASVGGSSVTLAQASFTLIASPVELGITQALWNSNRVLVLTACNDSGTSTTGSSCTAARYVAIDKALTSLGLTHQMTTSAAAFTLAMRGGLYDTFWIASDQSLVGDALTGEISEVVYDGATLIVDGAPSQCNTGFDALGGIASRSALSNSQNVTLNGPFYSAAQTVASVGSASALNLASGSSALVQATFSITSSGKSTTPPAMVNNKFGAGQTLIAGFDLGTTLVSQAAAWTPVLSATMNAVTPLATTSLTPGQYLPVQTAMANQGNAVSLDAQTGMPAAVVYLGSAPAATLITSSNTADWDFNLAVAQSNTLDLSMRAPATGGAYSLQTTVATLVSGAATPYGSTLPFPFTVTAAATHAANATGALQALTLTVKNDQSLRTSIVANISQAMNNFNLNTYTGYSTAISELVSISASLSGFSNSGTADAAAIAGVHAEIDRILQEAQWRWTLVQPEVGSTLVVDKTTCNPSDTVNLSETLTNVTLNTTLANLKLVTSVTGPGSGSTVLFSKTETLAQLAVGAKQAYSYAVAIGQAAPGTYQVSMTVQDANGNTLALSSGQFTVSSTATTGAGLSGTVLVSPQQVPAGTTAVITVTATDMGNSILSGLPLTLNIVDTATQKSVAQFPSSTTLDIGATYTGSSSWSVAGGAGTNYQAQLSATFGSLSLPLAQAGFSVIAPPLQLSIVQAPAAWQNLLVYSACKRATDGLLGQCGSVTLPVDNPASLALCDSSRASMVDQTLTSLGINHNVTTSAADFLTKLRSGQYNSYWISNGATVLPEPQASELRAAVTRGSGLLVDGIDGGVASGLAACAGVAYKAPYATSEPLTITGKLYTPGTISITNAPVQLSSANAAAVQATLGSGSSAGAGIVDGSYGSGKTVAFGFDWASAMGGTGANKAWPAIAQASLGYVTPVAAGPQYLPGDSITLATTVHNTGQAANLQIVASLPAGATMLGASPSALVSGNTVTWSVASAAGATQVFTLHLQAPQSAGSYAVATAINIVAGGKATLYQSESYSFTVESETQLMSQMIAAVQAQTLSGAQQQAAGAAILAQLDQAQTLLGAADSQDEILRLLLSVQTRLAKIDSGGTLEPMLAKLIATVERSAP